MVRNRIKYFVMDVDGTLTDGKIYMGSNGEMLKVFNVKDGYGIKNILVAKDVLPVIITGRSSDILKKRCNELEIESVYQGVSDKASVMLDIVGDLEKCRQVAYIGDDINDLSCMQLIKENGGVIGCPNDSADEVIDIADYRCKKYGGDGAVREFIEWLIKNKNII